MHVGGCGEIEEPQDYFWLCPGGIGSFAALPRRSPYVTKRWFLVVVCELTTIASIITITTTVAFAALDATALVSVVAPEMVLGGMESGLCTGFPITSHARKPAESRVRAPKSVKFG